MRYLLQSTFTLYFPRFTFLLLISLEKLFSNSLLLSILKVDHRSNIQCATTENEEQYTLRNLICIKFQNCSFFSLRSSFKEVLWKFIQTNQKIHVMEFLFSIRLQAEAYNFTKKYTPLQVFSKVFSDLELFIMCFSTAQKILFPRTSFSSGC